MILYIDTTDFNKATFALSESRLKLSEGSKKRLIKIQKKSYKIDPHKSHETLWCLEKFLLYHKIKLEEGNLLPIEKILVNKGPGSFTGVRVGVAHALALGFAWNVPVYPVKKTVFAAKLKFGTR